MPTELKVHPSFFKEFATKTWVSPTEIVKELVENAFDEDATRVLVTVLNDGSIAIEDDAGMDQNGMEKFLLLGSPHKKIETISPRLRRIRTGRYGTGRLSFLTSYERMKIRTKRGKFHKSLAIDADVLDSLFKGKAKVPEVREKALKREGSEIVLTGAHTPADPFRIMKEVRKLAVLRQPMFQVFIKSARKLKEWNFDGAEPIHAPEIQGHRLPVNLDNGRIIGEVVIARRPLSEDERGIAVMVGSHIVTRSNFGFDTKLNRVTGFVRCDDLTTRFADKSAIIEDEAYSRFNQQMKTFVIDTVIPGLTEYEDVLITREESRIYREIDKVLGQAMLETLETQEEVQGYEMVDVKEVVRARSGAKEEGKESKSHSHAHSAEASSGGRGQQYREFESLGTAGSAVARSDFLEQRAMGLSGYGPAADNEHPGEIVEVVDETQADGTIIRTRKVRRPILKKTFALKRIGYKVVPYEDQTDSRYSFTNENIVFVNKANPTYRAEATRGDEFLLRHVISIVAEAVAQTKHPEGKDALELQNRLVAEAIRIHDSSAKR
jgi:hypothetical protein